MSDFRRFAVYYLPEDAGLAAFGASWLGWDVASGKDCPQPDVPGLAAMTETPRKYGFHGTLKPPFRLAAGKDRAALEAAVAKLAETAAAVRLDGLVLAELGAFLALVPEGDARPLNDLAFRCVRDLDAFRAPASEAELARRRASGLSPRQETMLQQWGYPHVAEEFRFHLTLTGRLTREERAVAKDAVQTRLPALPKPFEIRSIALVGEDAAGVFHLVHRYALTG
jgi:putative phosphonate metabolism protein